MSTEKPDRRAKYEEKRDIKKVSFNEITDAEILAYVRSQENFSNWVKSLIQKEYDTKITKHS
jgi:predicted house-cleaning NTP pyrophosphatase (Maf/HAM1 superfamily)